jgi:hypothetical protein
MMADNYLVLIAKVEGTYRQVVVEADSAADAVAKAVVSGEEYVGRVVATGSEADPAEPEAAVAETAPVADAVPAVVEAEGAADKLESLLLSLDPSLLAKLLQRLNRAL